MLVNETTLHSAMPGTRNAKMIVAIAMTPDCQQNLVAECISVFPVSLAIATVRPASLNSTPRAQAHLSHRINGCLVHSRTLEMRSGIKRTLRQQTWLEARQSSNDGPTECTAHHATHDTAA